jgi:xanthine dehydrogenase accessory factor
MSVLAEQLAVAERWLGDGRRVVRALLVDAEGSSPFAPGAFMLIDGGGAIEGSITGGCVETDVVDHALALIEGSGEPRRLHYGVSDELALQAGLMCGGTVEVFAHELRGEARAVSREAFAAASEGLSVGVATLVDGPAAGATLAVIDGNVRGSLGGPDLLERTVTRDLVALGERGTSALRHYGSGGETLGRELAVHLQAFRAPPRLVLVGAIDYSAACAELASQIGYEVVIVDARAAFTQSQRFARHALVHVGRPEVAISERDLGPRDAVIVFSHDPKFDEPAILAALRSDAGYIGALGSRRTAAERQTRLARSGVEPDELARVHSPCGLDIGAATPEEVAISIMAEVIATRSGRAGTALVNATGAIRPR